VNETERQAILSRCVAPPTGRVVKLSGRWYVTDLENPGELLHGPEFKKKSDAVRYAEANASAVWKRLNQNH
jgi:hypothetical protein